MCVCVGASLGGRVCTIRKRFLFHFEETGDGSVLPHLSLTSGSPIPTATLSHCVFVMPPDRPPDEEGVVALSLLFAKHFTPDVLTGWAAQLRWPLWACVR